MRRRDLVVSSDEGDLQVIVAAVNRRLEADRPQPAAMTVLHPQAGRRGIRT